VLWVTDTRARALAEPALAALPRPLRRPSISMCELEGKNIWGASFFPGGTCRPTRRHPGGSLRFLPSPVRFLLVTARFLPSPGTKRPVHLPGFSGRGASSSTPRACSCAGCASSSRAGRKRAFPRRFRFIPGRFLPGQIPLLPVRFSCAPRRSFAPAGLRPRGMWLGRFFLVPGRFLPFTGRLRRGQARLLLFLVRLLPGPGRLSPVPMRLRPVLGRFLPVKERSCSHILAHPPSLTFFRWPL
jgi:hypothetical protein